MSEYIAEILDTYNGDIKGTATIPANREIFEINDKSLMLDDNIGENFHFFVAKLLWIMKRERHDTEVAIYFLCTRVTVPIEEDQNKLERLLDFLYMTRDDERIIGFNNNSTVYTYIDTSYVVHRNTREYACGVITFGSTIIHGKSSKQNIKVKSSTEEELVGMSEYIPYTLWFGYFWRHKDMN